MERVLLVGLGPTSLSALRSLAGRFAVSALIRPEAAGDETTAAARELGVPVITDASLNGLRNAIKQFAPRCVVISSYHRVLGAEILALCPFLNVHYSPLPAYRGRANVNWAVINGEAECAITVHAILPELDAGEILFQERLVIGEHDSVGDLYTALNGIQERELGRIVEAYLGGWCGERQEEAGASYCCTRVPEDGEIDWSASTQRIYNLIRALSAPYPAAFSYFGGGLLEIRQARPVQPAKHYVGRVPGRVAAVNPDGSVDVLTGDGILRLLEIGWPGEVSIAPSALVKSTRDTLGYRLGDALRRIQKLERELAALRSHSQEQERGEALPQTNLLQSESHEIEPIHIV